MQKIAHGNPVTQVALVAPDCVGLKPKLLIQVGQTVGLGEPLFVDKRDPQVQFVAPGTGRVVAINRGHRRKLESVVIELDSKAAKEFVFDPQGIKETADLRCALLKSGLWTGFRTRPYDRVADSTSSPSSVFVTAMDTRPLAPDPSVVIGNRRREFIAGMNIISQLGDWPVYLCTAPDWSGPQFDDNRIQNILFDGPHPAGLAGTHIHHLDPVGGGRMVWHIGYQDVIAMGHFFQTGQLLTERIVSIAGSAVKQPRLVRTRMGANVRELLDQELVEAHPYRVLSGSVLDGLVADGSFGYLGRYHNQISAVSDLTERSMFSWLTPVMRQYRITSLFSLRKQSKGYSTSSYSRQTAMIPVEAFDRIMPLDILLAPLLRAMLVKDTVAAQDLGCLELVEEDLALSSFICPAKQDYGSVLRINLNQIEQEG